MVYKIVTKEAKTLTATELVTDLSEPGDDYRYYMFLAKPTQYSEQDAVPQVYDNELTRHILYNDMLYGKKITPADASLMIPRYDYKSGTVYDAYDDNDQDLYSKKYFVVVNNAGYYDVFKCLNNNGGSPSLYAPERPDIGEADEIYMTADYYIWKYMFSVDTTAWDTFHTDKYMPVASNSSVIAVAVDGSIDVIKVEAPGSRYDNHLTGQIGQNDRFIGSSAYNINIGANNASSSTDNFYNGCVFKVVAGKGSGLYSTIDGYKVTGSYKTITLNSPLCPELDNTSQFEISPGVKIEGDVYQTANAAARAIINAVSNSIHYIEILNRGSGYRTANAVVLYDSTVPVDSRGQQAVVRPIISPYGGHGYDANTELGATRACFSVTFSELTDGFPTVNDFRQVGILYNPEFEAAKINLSTKNGSFQVNEPIYKIDPVRVFGTNITVSSSSKTITASSAEFEDLNHGDKLYLYGSGVRQLVTVNTVASNSSLTIDAFGGFSCTDTKMYLANPTAYSKVTTDGLDFVEVTQVTNRYTTDDLILGAFSGSFGVVDSMEVGGQASTLELFNQMWKYEVNTSDPWDVNDEVVVQDIEKDNSYFYGLANGVMYVTNQYGIVNVGGQLKGQTSGSQADVVNKYPPDLKFNSGKILYVENLEKVERKSGQKETFKIIFEY